MFLFIYYSPYFLSCFLRKKWEQFTSKLVYTHLTSWRRPTISPFFLLADTPYLFLGFAILLFCDCYFVSSLTVVSPPSFWKACMWSSFAYLTYWILKTFCFSAHTITYPFSSMEYNCLLSLPTENIIWNIMFPGDRLSWLKAEQRYDVQSLPMILTAKWKGIVVKSRAAIRIQIICQWAHHPFHQGNALPNIHKNGKGGDTLLKVYWGEYIRADFGLVEWHHGG